MKRLLYAVVCIPLLACSNPMTWTRDSTANMKSNKCYDIYVEPLRHVANKWGFGSLYIKIKNNTDSEIAVDWNNTYYLRNGATYGKFYRYGFIRDKDAPLSSDVIIPNGTLSAEIFPSILIIRWNRGYANEYLPVGENGVYVTVICDGVPIKETASINLNK